MAGEEKRWKMPEYKVWENMRRRTSAKAKPKDRANYFERGIGVCERWQVFELFLEDAGRRPSERHSLDRIDNNKGYEPGNVRWATVYEQVRNRRVTKLSAEAAAEIRRLVASGERIISVARKFSVSWTTVRSIVKGHLWPEGA